jgi:hypothetical protein
MAGDFDSKFGEEQAGEGAGGNPSGSLASAGALEDVAEIMGIVLDSASKIGVAGARPSEPASTLFVSELSLADVHDILPIFKVLVLDDERDWRPERLTVANAREEVDFVALDLHAAAATIALLASPQLVIDLIGIDRESGR